MNILTVCLENGSRSPGAAHVLRGMGHNAQSVALSETPPKGRVRISEDLLTWADRVFVFYEDSDGNDILFKKKFPGFVSKTIFIHQPDLWGGPVRQEHFDHFKKMFKEHPGYLADPLICSCGELIPDSEINYNNTSNEIGEDYFEVEADCSACGKEHRMTEWGEAENLTDAKEVLRETMG